MEATITLITLTLLRLVIPFGLVLLAGTLVERRDGTYRRA